MVGRSTTSLLALSLLVACAHGGVDAPGASLGPSGTGLTPPIQVLEERGLHRIETDGRDRYEYLVRYRVLTEEGAQAWRTIEATWSPWRQERPELTATVETPDGQRLTLDPSSVSVSPVDADGPSPRLRVSAEIPGVTVGALVEQRVVQADTVPLIPGSTSGRFYFGMRVPVGRSVLVLDVPRSQPVAVEVRGTELEPTLEETADRRRFTYQVATLDPLGPVDKHLPGDIARHPHVAWSTAPTWKGLEAALSRSVQRRLDTAELATLVEGVEGPRPEVVLSALERLRALVSETGRHPGEAPIVPLHPEETLARGQGADVDVAALLVGLLGSLGLDARLAFLRAGPGEDVRPDLPGLDAFNRVVVRVEGPAPLWVDPFDRSLAPGQLPPELQGRWALVLGTPDLQKTPGPSALDNRYLEHRVFALPDYGRARVVERTQAFGSIGARLRRQLRGEGDTRAAIAAYVRGQYGAGDLGEVEMTDPADLRTPIEISVEALETDVGQVNLTEASVEVRTSVLFGWLPPLLRDAAMAPVDKPDGATEQLRGIAAVLVARRDHPLLLPEPFVARLDFEVEAPAGFDLLEMPKDRELRVGPATFAATFETSSQGQLTGRLRFETGKGDYGADEVRDLVRGLRELWNEPILRFKYAHRGMKAIEAGNIKDGLASFAELATAFPRSAPHRARLALGLVRAGFGDAARMVAREAVALDPSSGVAQYVLGHVLAHDLVGRLYGPGFDREGAMDALRLVKAIEPGNVRARADLARLRSVDARGIETSDPVLLEAAVAEYRSLRQDTGITAFDDQLLEALLRAGRYEEVLIEARDARRSLRRDGNVIAARVALDENLNGLSSVLEALEIPQRAVPLVQAAAATALAGIGLYDDARALLARIPGDDEALGPLARQAERLQGLQPLEAILRPPGDPVRVVQEVLALALTGEVAPEALEPLMSARFGASRLEREAERLSRAFSGLARAADRSRVPPRVMRDGLLASTEFRAEGEAGIGFRVRAVLDGRPTWWFLRVEQGRARIVATEATPGAIGDVALDALEAEDRRRAGVWLDWAESVLQQGPRVPAADPFEELPFLRLRRQARSDAEAAALALSALGPTPEGALGRLAKRAQAAQGVLRDTLEHARLLGLVRVEKNRAARSLVAQLLRRNPDSAYLEGLEVAVLLDLESWQAAGAKLKRRLARKPEDTRAQVQLANLETARGRFDRARQILEKLASDEAEASSVILNNLAWVSLFQGDAGPLVLARAQRATQMSRGRSPAELHTLAAVHAERGDARETVELVRQRLDLRDAEAPESMDYYLLGRVMEHAGLWRLARDAYLRVEKDEGSRADSTHALAQRRLRRLGRKSAI